MERYNDERCQGWESAGSLRLALYYAKQGPRFYSPEEVYDIYFEKIVNVKLRVVGFLYEDFSCELRVAISKGLSKHIQQ